MACKSSNWVSRDLPEQENRKTGKSTGRKTYKPENRRNGGSDNRPNAVAGV
jgi:hypothetical protein